MDVCLRVLKVPQLQCQEPCIDNIPYCLSGLSSAHFVRQPFSKQLYQNICIVLALTLRAWFAGKDALSIPLLFLFFCCYREAWVRITYGVVYSQCWSNWLENRRGHKWRHHSLQFSTLAYIGWTFKNKFKNMVNGQVCIQHHIRQKTQFSAFPDKGAGLHVA